MYKNFFKTFLSQIPFFVWISIGIALSINTLGLLFIFTHHDPYILVSGDGPVYFELADNLSKGFGFGVFRDEVFVPELFRTPGLPFLLAIFFQLGLGLKSYFIFISFLSAVLIPSLSWYIGKSLFEQRVGVMTAALLAFEPLVWLHNWAFLSEIPFLIILLLGIVFLIKAYKKNSYLSYYTMGSGILLACSVYIRPAVFPLLLISLLGLFVERSVFHKKLQTVFLGVLVILFACLTPWYERVHELSGVYALSGTGWRNVYTDYLASIRAVKNDTKFIDEKNALKNHAISTLGLTRKGVDNPALSSWYRSYALPEIIENPKIVLKLQAVLFISYFTHTDYQRKLQRFSMLPLNKIEQGRISASRLIIEEGLYAIPKIYSEMRNRYFLPVFERFWAVSILLLSIVGFFTSKSSARYLIFMLLLFGYFTSSAIGFGVESRLRLPILPFYFMLTSCGILFMHSYFRNRYSVWKK